LAPPKPGEVINYSYLWEREYREGRDEGIKDRPVAVILVTQSADGLDQIHVVPMTRLGARDVKIGERLLTALRPHYYLPRFHVAISKVAARSVAGVGPMHISSRRR